MTISACEKMPAAKAETEVRVMGDETSQEPGIRAEEPAPDVLRLVEAIASGDRGAEHEFVELYQPRVRALLLARTRNPDAAADLVQDVIVEAICALRRGQIREPGKLTQFVLGITRNLLRGHFRGLARQPEPLEMPDQLPDLSPAGRQLDERREHTALQAIASLDVVDRTILHLTLVDGLKPGAIAERLRLSSDVVRQRKLRATRRVIDLVRGQSQKPSSLHIVSGQRK